MDPDLELIAPARPGTGTALVARPFAFSSIFRGTTKKQLPRPSSHNCRVRTDRYLWAGAHAAHIQMMRVLTVSETERYWMYTTFLRGLEAQCEGCQSWLGWLA